MGLHLEIDDALDAERRRDVAARGLRWKWKEDTVCPAKSRLVASDDLGEVGRPELLLALGDDHEIDRELAGDGANRRNGIQERALGALLIGRAARRQHASELVIDDGAIEWRDPPIAPLDGLHVVHHVDDE